MDVVSSSVEKNEGVTFVDRVTGYEVLQLTNSKLRSVHSYYDIPPWSPMDRQIAFSRLEPGATEGEICVMSDQGKNLKCLGISRAMTSNDGAMAQWSADGFRVYFNDREAEERRIGWADIQSGQVGFFSGGLRMVCPTGNRQVFHTNCGDYADHDVVRLREEHGVFIQDLKTGDVEQIVSVADCYRIHPRRDEISEWHLYVKHTKWSPDGTRLMFVFTNEIRFSDKYMELPRVKDIYVVNGDGSGLKRVSEFGNHPLWHPNGHEILTNSPFEDRPGNSLVLHNVETGRLRLAFDRLSGSGHPSFSPDGKQIVIDHVLGTEGSGSLTLIDVEMGTARHLVQVKVTDHSHVGTHLHPVWSRDGKQVLYASDASGIAQLCVINV